MNMPDILLKEVINTIEWYYVLDEETDRVLYASQALIRQCGADLMEKPCREVLEDSPLLRIFQAPIPPEGRLEWELAIGEQHSYLLIRNRRIWYGGRRCRVGVIIHASDIIGISRDMSKLIVEYQQTVLKNKELLEELNWNAFHDRLTSLHNRNKYIQDCSGLFSHKTGYGVMSLDINNLKWVNDHLGHEQGDRYIRCVGDALRAMEEKERTYCYRVGGDEFVLVHLDTTEDELMAIRNQICAYVAGTADSRAGVRGTPDVSGAVCGTADSGNAVCAAEDSGNAVCEVAAAYAVAEPGMDFDTVFKLADDRMYMQKRKLKGRF